MTRRTIAEVDRDLTRVEGDVKRVSEKQDDHEKVCAERYGNIHKRLDEQGSDLKDLKKLFVGLILAIAGFLAVDFVNGLREPSAPPVASQGG